jgi:F-type H+-transporting ATPase subunit c
MKKMFAMFAVMFVSVSAFAQEGAVAATASNDRGLVAIAAALAIAISVLGGALAQGKTAATALEGIARNPAASGKLLIPMILGLALIESLVIYALIIALGLK